MEADGIPTLILGSALDILSAGRPPRVQFLNYPLGFSTGGFRDSDNQYQVVRAALSGFDEMTEAGIVRLDFSWYAGWQMINQREGTSSGDDVRSPRDLTPRYQTEDDRRLAESRQPG
jgi:D-proline reductase (dithiol) PrdB